MKKQLLTAILALASLAATAATGSGTFYLGGQSTWDGYGSGSNPLASESVPFISTNTYSSCQAILTSDALTSIVPTTAADGTTTYANIKTLTIKAYSNAFYGCYGGDGSLDITLYIENIDPASFPKKGSDFTWHPFSTENPIKVSIPATEVPADETFDISFTLPEELKYAGQGLLLTFFTENTCEFYGEIMDAGVYTVAISGCACAMDSKDSALNPMTSGNISPSATVPDIKFNYELVEEKAGPSVTPGEATTASIGTKKSQEIANLPGTNLPLELDGSYYPTTISQVIYTPTELGELYKIDANGTTKAEISSLTFFIDGAAGVNYEGSFEVTVYAHNQEGLTFPIKNSKPQWIDYSSDVKGTGTPDLTSEEWFGMFNYYQEGGCLPVTVTFDEPIIYEGKGLVLTFVTNSTIYDNMGSGSDLITGSYVFSSTDGNHHSGVIAGKSVTATGELSNPRNYLPYLEIGYTPLTYGASQDVVSFESVTYSTNVVTGTSSTSTRLNNLAVHFTINDPGDHAPYTIKQGNDVLGTVSTKEGTINFFQKPAKDVILSVVPTGDAIGTTATVPADAFDAFFGAPTVEPVATGLWGEIDLKYNTPTKVDCSGVAQFRVTASTDAAYFSITSTGAQIITENSDLPEGFEGFYPAGTWNDIKACNGLVAYRKVGSIVSATLKGGMFTWPSSRMSIALGFGVNYPLVNAIPAVSDGDVPPAAAPAKAGETKLVVKYNNGSSYGADQCSAVFDEASTLTHFSYVYPNDLAFRDLTETEGCIMFVAPEGHKLQHAVEELLPATPAAKAVAREVTDEAEGEHAWEDLDGQFVTYAIDDYRGKNIHIRSIDGNGATSGHLSYGIDADGNVSGIADALAPAEAEAQWFNLQGIEITEPAAAGIYIRRQGNSAVKVIIK